jgi:hypothetical protein
VDRIVAVVDDDPILLSDMRRAVNLGLMVPGAGETPEDFRRRVLDRLIVERLRTHEVDRFGFSELPLAEVDSQYQAIRERFPDEATFRAELRALGLDPSDLREILARQLMVLKYVEERLGPRVFIALDDVRGYYDEVLAPEMERRGQPLPPLPEVREQIRSVLRQQRLNEELESWTEELRLEADIVDYLEREPRELPPVIE